MGAALLGLLAVCAPLQAQQNLSATKIGSRVDVTIADKFFTSYHCLADENHPCFFPVNGPSGASVTSMRNGEYPHHSSLFFGCDLVNGGNYWQEGLENIEIGKTNHSLFSARMAPDLTPACGGTLVNAAGASGEKATFGFESPWLACFGPRVGSAGEGLAILQHPANPGFPSKWFTRDYGFLSPTPMYWPADGKGTRLAKGEKLQLRYRVLVFSGSPQDAGIAERYSAYAAGAAR